MFKSIVCFCLIQFEFEILRFVVDLKGFCEVGDIATMLSVGWVLAGGFGGVPGCFPSNLQDIQPVSLGSAGSFLSNVALRAIPIQSAINPFHHFCSCLPRLSGSTPPISILKNPPFPLWVEVVRQLRQRELWFELQLRRQQESLKMEYKTRDM